MGMDLIFYFIKVKFKLIFRNFVRSGSKLAIILVSLFLIIYAFLSGILLNRLVNNNIISRGNIFTYVYCITFSLVFISFFFPKYNSSKELFSRIYPLNNLSRVLTGIIGDLISGFIIILFVILVVLILSFKIPFLNRIEYVICTLLGIINSVILSRIVRFLFERDFSKTIYRISGLFFMFIICAAILIFVNEYNNSLLFNLIISVVSFCIMLFLNKYTYDNRLIHPGPQLPFFFQIFTRNKIFRVSVLIMFLIKSGLILFFFFLRKIKPDPEISFDIPIIFFTSPMLMFTYLYNNFFGFFPGIISNFKVSNSDFNSFYIFFIKGILPVMLIDWILSFIFIMIDNYDLLIWSFFYLSLLLVLTSISFHLSVFKPKLIKSSFSSSNSRPLLNSISLIPTLISTLCFVYFQYFMPVIFILYCIIAILITHGFKTKYRNEFLVGLK